MPVRWVVDPLANEALWGELAREPLGLVDGPGRWVADVGGGNGNFVSPLLAKGARLVTIDVERSALARPYAGIRAVAGSLLHLPLRDGSVDGVAGRAVFHHVPDALDAALREAERVVKPGGLVLFQEPTSGNPLARAARRYLPTHRHDPHERPLPYAVYLGSVRRHFDVLGAEGHFLLAYLLPHVIGRISPDRRGFARALTRRIAWFDRRLLAVLPGLNKHAAYISILARRRPA